MNHPKANSPQKSMYDCLSPDERRLVARWQAITLSVAISVILGMPMLFAVLEHA